MHAGSAEHRSRLRLLDRDHARITLPVALPLAPGDRFVLRSSGRQATIGGAEVLDVVPARRTADALARVRLPLTARVFASQPWCTPEAFERHAGHAPDGDDVVAVGQWLTTPD